ncbi:glycosyltransferase family 2 protein [Luteolibacter sp. AS25]|uniref:glycosyltransferase family 2 protein n=1 Tax=Luteolibacter sp. AS25 TaxID=3135776 RepID=UPI00398B8153
MKTAIVIPTYNRASCLAGALRSALGQSYPDIRVIVIDDASSDDTGKVVEPFLNDSRVSYVKLGKNVGTALAKNLGIALSDCEAITFHDSDDEAERHKILLQTRAISLRGKADEILDWEILGYAPGSELAVDVVVGAHKFIKLDGSVFTIGKRVSLVDDFFPTIQSPSKTEGDWVLINSGLFRKSCFHRLGGYLDSVEEDRELRNRLLASGHIFHFIEEPLLTKVETAVSLTTDGDTGYRGERRRADREEVWKRNRVYRNGKWGRAAAEAGKVVVDFRAIEIEGIRNGGELVVDEDFPMTAGSRDHLSEQLARCL